MVAEAEIGGAAEVVGAVAEVVEAGSLAGVAVVSQAEVEVVSQAEVVAVEAVVGEEPCQTERADSQTAHLVSQMDQRQPHRPILDTPMDHNNHGKRRNRWKAGRGAGNQREPMRRDDRGGRDRFGDSGRGRGDSGRGRSRFSDRDDKRDMGRPGGGPANMLGPRGGGAPPRNESSERPGGPGGRGGVQSLLSLDLPNKGDGPRHGQVNGNPRGDKQLGSPNFKPNQNSFGPRGGAPPQQRPPAPHSRPGGPPHNQQRPPFRPQMNNQRPPGPPQQQSQPRPPVSQQQYPQQNNWGQQQQAAPPQQNATSQSSTASGMPTQQQITQMATTAAQQANAQSPEQYQQYLQYYTQYYQNYYQQYQQQYSQSST